MNKPDVIPMVDWDDIEDGDVLAFHGRGFWSSLIRLRTWSPITHCGFACWFGNMLCVFEARECRGVRLYPLERYLGSSTARVDLYKLRDRDWQGDKMLRFDRDKMIEWAKGHWGCRYAHPMQFLRSFGIVTRKVCDALHVPIDTDANRFFCSEFVVAGLNVGLGRDVTSAPAAGAPPAVIATLKELKWQGRIPNEAKGLRASSNLRKRVLRRGG